MYGYKAHIVLSVSPSRVHAVMTACVTGAEGECPVMRRHLPDLPACVKVLLLDAGYDDEKLVSLARQQAIQVVAPLRQPLGPTSAPARRERATFVASPSGKKLFQQRATSIEPFFATLKALFGLARLPVRGKARAANTILGALYAWNLLIRFNAHRHAPLGVVKPFLEML